MSGIASAGATTGRSPGFTSIVASAYAGSVATTSTRRRIWLSEQGVLISLNKVWTPGLYQNPAAQRIAAYRFTQLAAQDNQIALVGYYQFSGAPDGFDSGLTKVSPQTASLPPSAIFRSAYCHLAKRDQSLCANSDGT